MENITTELQKAKNLELSIVNKEKQMDYRNHIKMIKEIYEMAKNVLDDTLGENYLLPIDIKKVAHGLGFVILETDFSKVEKQYIDDEHDCIPISQLKMRRKFFGTESDKICGTINLSDNLSDYAMRFSIAHQLGIFALRNKKRVDSYVEFELYAGLYPTYDTEEMLADIFAYALLLPYHLFEKARIKFESDRTCWSLDYATWISYIRDKAQIPEYHVILAHQELKKINIYLKYETAKRKLFEKLESLTILELEEQNACLELYARVIDNLETWGFSQSQIAKTLFHNVDMIPTERLDMKASSCDIIDYIHDYYIKHNIRARDSHKEYPFVLVKEIATSLKNVLNISEEGISKIMEISVEDMNQKKILFSPSKNSF